LCDASADRLFAYGKRRNNDTPSSGFDIAGPRANPAQRCGARCVEDVLVGAPLNDVLTTITRLIEAHSTGMLCSIFLLDEDTCAMASPS